MNLGFNVFSPEYRCWILFLFFILSFIQLQKQGVFHIPSLSEFTNFGIVQGKIKFHFKGIEDVVSSDTPYIEWHVRFTRVPLQPWSDQE